MEKNKNITNTIWILAVIIWMIIVFYFSSQVSEASGNTSGSLISFFLTIFKKDWSAQELANTIEVLQPFVRKLAHFTLYAIGGFVIYGVDINSLAENKYKYINKFTLSTVFGLLYAISDEIHQHFVPGRAPGILDVCIDTLGIIFGCCLHIIFNKLKKILK